MELYLHIGSHKTGTSSFQQLLHDSRGHGSWYYPQTGLSNEDVSHNKLGALFWDDEAPSPGSTPFDQIMGSLEEEISGRSHVIISSEMLEKVPIRGRSDRLVAFASRISALGYRIHLIYTVRRQDFLVDSIFKQWVAAFDTRYADTAAALATNEIPSLNYLQIIESWTSVIDVASICIVPFLEQQFSETLAGLCRSVCVSGLEIKTSKVSNPSLEGDVLRFKHFCNRFISDRSLNDALLSALFEIQSVVPKITKTSIFDQAERDAFLVNFKRHNEGLASMLGSWASLWINPPHQDLIYYKEADSETIRTILLKLKLDYPALYLATKEMIGS